MTRAFTVFALLFAFACNGDKTGGTGDTSTTGGTDTDTTDTTDTTNPPHIDSCDWGSIGLCYEFVDFGGTEDWCNGEYTATGEHTYVDAPCPSGADASCELDAIPSAGNEPGTAYYYDFPGDAEQACTESGGTYTEL